MRLRWTEDAASDLEHITDYLFENAPEDLATIELWDAHYSFSIPSLAGRFIHGM